MPSLVTSGTPTLNADSSCLIDSVGADRVSVPDVSLLNKTQMWVACRVKVPWAQSDTTVHRFFTWGTDTNEEIYMQRGAVAGQFNVGREHLNTGSTAYTGFTYAAGSTLTLIGIWTATTCGFSFNGGAIATVANTEVPTLEAATVWDIGQRGYSAVEYADSDYYWLAAGTGTLTNDNVATINGWGNPDRAWEEWPGTITFLWWARDFEYQDDPTVMPIAWTGL